MARLFVIISLLSVALVGCGSDSTAPGGSGGNGGVGGDAGTGGSGGAGGSGELAGDACLDDLGILAEIEDITALVTDQCLAPESRGCAVMQQVPQCVAECLDEEVGLPRDCGLCIGLVSECILRECISDCIEPDSTACGDCVASVRVQCDEFFEPCAGFPAP